MASQGSSPKEKSVSDDVAEDSPSTTSRARSWLLLLPLIVFGVIGGAWLSYSQYGAVTQTISRFSSQLGMKDEASKSRIQYGKFMKLKNVIANPAGTDGGQYLMVNIGFESQDEAVLDELKTKEIVVRDAILSLLSTHTPSELGNSSRRDSIKEAIRQTINKDVLREGDIQRMYFTQYILQ